jgi:phage/plasmid-like protein (TIGR03299 family)
MSHEINSTDNFGEVRSNGKRAWHGLGIEIEEGLTAQEGFKKIGLDWSTSLAPLTATLEDGSKVPVSGRAAHIRNDTKAVLGVVASNYPAVENMELASFADELVQEGGLTIETAGSLRDGKNVFALCKLPTPIVAAGDDVVELYTLISNGHGGTGSFAIYPTSVRVVCANTLRWSEKDAAKGLSFIHFGNTSTEDRLKTTRTALGLMRLETDKFREQVDAMVKTNLTAKRAKDLFLKVYEDTFGKIPSDVDSATREKLIQRRQLILESWELNFANERNNLKGIEGTVWSAFNAVTEWHDHDRGFSEVGSEQRMNSNLFGTSHVDKKKALRSVLAAV